MKLLVAILALLTERLSDQVREHARAPMLSRYVALLRGLLPGQVWWVEWPVVFLVVVPPVVTVSWLENSLPYPFGWLLLAGTTLWLSLGPYDLGADIHRLLAARARGDHEGEQRILRRLMRVPHSADDPSAHTVLGAMFVQSHERLFGTLLWFFALGPTGAVFYRLTSLLPQLLHNSDIRPTPGERFAEQVHDAAAWIPARLTALLFGLAGTLDGALDGWKLARLSEHHGWRSQTWAVLSNAACGALQTAGPHGEPVVASRLDDMLREALGLQRRALLICLAGFAVFTSGGWIQ